MGKEKIQAKYDRYVDALVDLYMECYSDVLTEEICNDIKRMKEQPVEVPAQLRRNCIARIKKESARNRRNHTMKRIGKTLRAVAALAVVILALSSVLFVSVEAVRVPIINYYIEKGDTRWSFSPSSHNDMHIPEDMFNRADPLAGLICEQFRLVTLDDDPSGNLLAVYEDPASSRIVFTCTPISHSSIDVNTEGAQSVTELQVHEHDGLLVINDGYITVFWIDKNLEYYFSIIANGVPDTEVILLAEKVASTLDS